MAVERIKENIYAVGAKDWERRLFDELIPLPDGTTYNSYLIKGRDKIALLDTVDPTKSSILIENLKRLEIETVDFVVAHHAEQDHSGSLPVILEHYKTAKVVTNPKCKELLMSHLLIPEDRFITIADGETLSLGDKTLQFIYAPWVHWPETMFTYLKEDKILFTCDFLGSHLAQSELFAVDPAKVYESNKRYYAEIMMPFRTSIRQHLEKIKNLAVEIVAPSHGPLFNKPGFILGAYQEWASDQVKNEVVLPYVSMHGSTAEMVRFFMDKLMQRGITVRPFNLPRTDIGELAMALVDAATIVIGTPTVLIGPHPAAVYAAYLANALRPKTRFVSIIGSYGWGGKMVETLSGLIANLKVELLSPVVVRGYPKAEDFKALEQLAESIAAKHKNDSLVIK